MRRLFAFILLLVFAISYARQASYWECMIFGYFQPGPEKCDCSKFVNEAKNAAEPFSLPSHQHHFHTDELYDAVGPSYLVVNLDGKTCYCILSFALSEGLAIQPDRPPAF